MKSSGRSCLCPVVWLRSLTDRAAAAAAVGIGGQVAQLMQQVLDSAGGAWAAAAREGERETDSNRSEGKD